MEKIVSGASPLKMAIPIIKIVGNFCNLRCGYCFYHTEDQDARHVMSEGLLEKFLSEYMKLFSGHLIFIWHGGEPLFAGLPFFKKIIDFQKRNIKPEQTIQNNIQTNATLINDEWAEFFKENCFRVGVSLDGDQKSHNLFRKDRDGDGSFNRVMRGVEILRRHGIKPGFIQTITHENVSRAKKDFIFFTDVLKAKGWGVNAYLDIDQANSVMAEQEITNEDFIKFLITYINFWLAKDDQHLRIREIDNFISGIIGRRARNCAFNGSCADFFCLEYNGKIYPCDRSSNHPELLLGDLSQQLLSEILNSSTRLNYTKKINSPHSDCIVCEWQSACHNGCAMQRINGIDGKHYYCETRKTIFEYLKEKVIKLKKIERR